MNNKRNITHTLTQVAEELSEMDSLRDLFHQYQDGDPLPSGMAMKEIVGLVRSIVFPGYYGMDSVHEDTLRYHMGVNVLNLHKRLVEQILAALCFEDDRSKRTLEEYQNLVDKATMLATETVTRLKHIREILSSDVEAAYNGDPAAENYGEIISCYPVIKALVNYRFAHELHLLGVPLLPRMITEMAHSETGIDIHPGASIGHHFTIDHGTGVVIGATCIIGNYVKLYQGVTLGAKSFPLDENGNPIKGIPRHPILEDDVIVYSNATVLGRITIARGTVIGGNVWVTESTKPGEHIVQNRKSKTTE